MASLLVMHEQKGRELKSIPPSSQQPDLIV